LKYDTAMSEELRTEYESDYSQANPNRFAAKMQRGGKLVVLDPDIAAAFPDSAKVNTMLRSLLSSNPPSGKEASESSSTHI
jgi:hypothetical protein